MQPLFQPVFISAVLTLFALAASATVIVVDVNGGGDYLTIGEAMTAAAGGDTIGIAPGVYTGPDNRGLDPAGKTLVIIGLEGPDSTIIDCEDLDRAFWISNGIGPEFLLEGLTIKNGYHGQAGALWSYGSSPTIRNCVFRECRAIECGGGARCSNSGATFEDCAFIDNYAGFEGGAIYVWGTSHVTLTGVVIEGNGSSGSGGGLRTCPDSSTTLTDVVFYGNVAGSNGGGALFYGVGTNTLTNVLFARNVAEGARGGAFSSGHDAATSLDGCALVFNEASQGSAIGMSPYEAPVDVSRSIIAFNVPGAPVFCDDSPVTFTHCCVFGNAVTDSLCGDHHENIFWNPGFCDRDGDDYTLYDVSPCLPENNPWGELIGLYGQGCVYSGPLDPPQGLAATTDGGTAFLSWRPVVETTLDYYLVERDTTALFGAGTMTASTRDTLFTDSPLSNWREYFYRAFTVDDVGGLSAPSETISIVVHPIPPAAPTALFATAGDAEVDLVWDPCLESDVTHYVVYRDTVPGAPPGGPVGVATDPMFTDTDLQNYRSYYYRVAAVDTSGLVSDPSNEARAVAHGVPPAVTGLRAVPGDSAAFLDWDPVAPPYQDFYRIYRDTIPSMLSRTLLADGFETCDPGQPPPDPPWSLIEQSGTSALVTDAFAGGGTRSLALADSSFSYVRVFHGLGDTTEGSARIRFLVRPGAVTPQGNLLQCELSGEQGIGYQAGLLEVRDGQLRHWLNGTGAVTIAPLTPELWHEIDWRLDCAADTYCVWLDGEHVVEGAPFYNDARHLDLFQFRTRSTEWSRNWIDDVLWLGHVEHTATTAENAYVDQPLESGRVYYYQVTVVDTFGTEGRLCEPVPVEPGWAGVDEEASEPLLAPAVSLTSPNPFRSVTAFSYTVPDPGARVAVRIYDLGGRLVTTLLDNDVEGGSYRLSWSGRDRSGRAVASGVYFCRVTIGDWNETRKTVVVR